MAAAAARQTTTVAHSPSGFLYDIIDKVWVVALAVNVGRFFRVLSAVLYAFCRSPSGHPVAQCFLPLGRLPLEVCTWRYHGCDCRSFGGMLHTERDFTTCYNVSLWVCMDMGTCT